MRDIVIWGAGNWGRLAYWYYKDKGNILFYVDIAPNKLGTNVPWCDLQVHPIEDLKRHKNATVIVAVSKNEGIEGILVEFGITDKIMFSPNMLHLRNTSIMAELNEKRSINLGEFLQGVGIIKLQLTFGCWGSGPLDYAFIRALAMKYKAKKYLEIGTYIGESLKAVADICEQCYSITAPKDAPFAMTNICKASNYPDYTDRLADDSNVTHYYCDSQIFDWNQVPKDIDLYFIDGDHSYKGVYCDTKNVFLHKTDDAIVVWHDFKNANPSVTTSEVATAVKDAIGDSEFENVYCVDHNMCGVYLPPKYQSNFSLRSCKYTEEPQTLYYYETELMCRSEKAGR